MSSASKQTEVVTAVSTGWTQLDITPLNPRSYVEVLNNDTTQSVGIVITSGTAPTSGLAWNQGRQVMKGDSLPIVPAGQQCAVYARTESGPMSAGAALILCEWS
jgi:hypothetical protein